MMPAASTKADKKTSPEVDDAIKQVLIVMDKKVRNLEKRKSKLDGYKAKAENGVTLEKDQQVAVDRYGEVLQNLEFARELQKHFMSINADNEKFLKKQAKREKIERQTQDTKKLKSVLSIQNLLTDMGSDTVRSDFQTGKHGAVVLTEENLNQLDELYKLISPTRDGESDYKTALNEASEHLYNLIEAREKEVVGTTYKDLKEMIDLIDGCGYFENAPYSEETPVEEAPTNSHEFAVSSTEVPEPESELAQASLPPEMPMEPEMQPQIQPAQEMTSQQEVSQGTMGDIVAAEADSFFSAPAAPQSVATAEQQQQQAFQRQRPFQEIVSSVQGSFNFLQESTIDMESPHMDPAVVAAHPMPTAPHARPQSTRTPDTTSLSQSGFGPAGYGDQTKTSLDTDNSVNVNTTADQTSLRAQSQNVSTAPQDYSNAAFGQTSLSQSLQSDNSLFSSAVEDQTSNISHSVLGQTVSDTTISQFEIPPSIPMPPSHEQSQENQSHQSQPEKKQFTMNPNAGEFQSLLYSQNSPSPDETAKTDLALSNDVNQTNFQGGFGSDNFQQPQQSQQQQQQNSQHRGGRGGGGYRGNNRGNRSGGGGMTNGFSRGGNRGGYGGGGYQGYPPRNDYRPEGYQGYGGRFNSGDFNKRGGGSDGNRGSSRGGNRGGMRGGYSRGGGAPRGGRGGNTGGGFGRPNFNQQQPIAQQ